MVIDSASTQFEKPERFAKLGRNRKQIGLLKFQWYVVWWNSNSCGKSMKKQNKKQTYSNHDLRLWINPYRYIGKGNIIGQF